MAGNKYLSLVSGVITEVASVQSSAGAGDAGKIVALDSGGKIDSSMMPAGIGTDSTTMTASEALSAGDLVNVWDSTGPKIRKADASNGRRADGFVLASISSSASGTVYFEGTITGLSSLTPGVNMFLGTSGAATATAPTTSGHISQQIGRTISTTAITFEPALPITLA